MSARAPRQLLNGTKQSVIKTLEKQFKDWKDAVGNFKARIDGLDENDIVLLKTTVLEAREMLETQMTGSGKKVTPWGCTVEPPGQSVNVAEFLEILEREWTNWVEVVSNMQDTKLPMWRDYLGSLMKESAERLYSYAMRNIQLQRSAPTGMHTKQADTSLTTAQNNAETKAKHKDTSDVKMNPKAAVYERKKPDDENASPPCSTHQPAVGEKRSYRNPFDGKSPCSPNCTRVKKTSDVQASCPKKESKPPEQSSAAKEEVVLAENLDKTVLEERVGLQQQIRRLQKENRELKQERTHLIAEAREMKDKNKEVKEKLMETETAKDLLLSRLSRFAADKLMADNPNIADLSDENRPTKLGEMYSELYDNEWTDAIEGLTKVGYTELEAVHTLRETLLHVSRFCVNKSKTFMSKMEAAVYLLFEDQELSKELRSKTERLQSPKVPAGQQSSFDLCCGRSVIEDMKLQFLWKPKGKASASADMETEDKTAHEVKDMDVKNKLNKLQKDVSLAMVSVIQKAYFSALWDKTCIKDMKPFIKKCLFICWMMVVQNPPLCFQTDHSEGRLVTDLFKFYVTGGPYVEYVVWPALLLHKKGPVLCKGVAEGKKSK